MPQEPDYAMERDGKWFVAWLRRVAGANGQGHTREECLQSLREAVALIESDSVDSASLRVEHKAEVRG